MCPTNSTDAHVRLPNSLNLQEYLCIKTERTVRNDNTIAYDGRLYQIEEAAAQKVTVQERFDGSMRVMSKGVSLRYREIEQRAKKEVHTAVDRRKFYRPSKPDRQAKKNPAFEVFLTSPFL